MINRIETGENPRALSTSERIVGSIIFDRPEWRPAPYSDLEAALGRLGEWREATLNYWHIHGCLSWREKPYGVAKE